MKTIRIFQKTLSLFFALLMLSMSSCSKDGLENSTQESYMPREIFQSIFFLKGDFVDEIPTLRNMKINSKLFSETAIYVASKSERKYFSKAYNEQDIEKKTDEIIDFITDEVNELNPKAFEYLSQSIKSRNPDKVIETVKEISLLIKAALFKIDGFGDGIILMEEAYSKSGIDPTKYDFSNTSDVDKYINDMNNFNKKNPKYSKSMKSEQIAGLAVVVMVVAVVYLAVAFLAAVAVAGEVVVTYFNVLWIHNWFWVAETSISTKRGSLQMNTLVAELIDYEK